MKIHQGKQNLPRRVLIYGENKIGKSRFAASFPRPLFLNIEDGLGDIDCDKTDRLREFDDVVNAVSYLIQNPHEYKTVVIDTADWLERLLFKHVARDKGKLSIEDIGFGKGYEAAADKWQFLIGGLTELWRRGMHVVFTCHLQIKKFADPGGETYSYYAPALHEKGSSAVCEWCDEILFATTKVHVLSKDEGFGAKRTIAIDDGQKILITVESPCRVAGNRLGFPPEIPFTLPFDWSHWFGSRLQAPAPEQKAIAGNIAGVVTDGSSKKAS